jgi:hypothetical protein
LTCIGFGPSFDGLFYQSNLGVVTKLGIQMTPAPEAYATLEVDVPNEEDLPALIGTISDLMRRSIILNSPSFDRQHLPQRALLRGRLHRWAHGTVHEARKLRTVVTAPRDP